MDPVIVDIPGADSCFVIHPRVSFDCLPCLARLAALFSLAN